VLPISVKEASGELVGGPTFIDYGPVQIGMESTEVIEITNIGTDHVLFNEVVLTGSEDFTIDVDGVDPRDSLEALSDPDGDGVQGLAPGGRMEMSVTFTSPSRDPVIAELTLLSDAISGPFVVRLQANGAGSCLQADPSELDFGEAATGVPHRRVLHLESCGMEAVTIERIEIVEGSNLFIIDDEDTEGGILPGVNPTAEMRPRWGLPIDFQAMEDGVHSGLIRIHSTDTANPILEVPLRGTAVRNDCPVAAVDGEIFEVRPLDIVTLDGSPSIDPDGPNGLPVNYEWTVIERPEGSTAQPLERFENLVRPADGGEPDMVSTPRAQFFVDLAGEYVVALRVVDNAGATAPSAHCVQEDAVIRIRAVPSHALHIQLVWSTEADEDLMDNKGTDVDIHLLHPEGENWFTPMGGPDCFWRNRNPDWGEPNVRDDDPSLDIDDINGAGPENINLDAPQDTTVLSAPYRVGVHYYQAVMDPFGTGDPVPSEATVRIYLNGVPAFESRQTLTETGEFWNVGNIHWTDEDPTVEAVGGVTVWEEEMSNTNN